LSHPWEVTIRRGDVAANERLYWADPNFLDVLRLPVFAGNPLQALQEPDGVVMTRSLARKYFGDEQAVGQSVELITLGGRAAMRVLAVLEDLPSNTHLDVTLLGSARARFSQQSVSDAAPDSLQSFPFRVHTYLRLAKGADASRLQAAMPEFLKRHFVGNQGVERGLATLQIMPLADIHFAPPAEFTFKPRGDRSAVYSILLVGVLIVLVAVINFVNLTTARVARRSMEVGVRKAAGATRRVLFMQFIGEALIYCLVGALLAVAITELLLPYFNALLDRTISFSYWRDPQVTAGIIGLVLAAALGGGAYPALVLAGLAPGRVLKDARLGAADGGLGRTLLVVGQFTILIVLVISAAIVYRQTDYAMNAALRLDRESVLLVDGGCTEAFENRVAALPGVRSTGCVSREALDMDTYSGGLAIGDRSQVQARYSRVGFGFFETVGLAPLGGRSFARTFGADQAPENPTASSGQNIVINEAAARALGFADPVQAANRVVRTTLRGNNAQSTIVGVMPDFHFAANRQAVVPSVYYVDMSARIRDFYFLSVKLDGQRLPEAVQAIDAAWAAQGARRPISRQFLDRYVQELYATQRRQSVLLTVLSVVAISIAVLGLFGLTVFATERRTREIGVRKALGASSANIVRLLLWQFSRPVLWANLIAWPVAAWLMHRWLAGFAYRIELPLWVFPATTVAALVIALATVATHSIRVARARPISALRYE
jgi:putative ABC transport system permease protein